MLGTLVVIVTLVIALNLLIRKNAHMQENLEVSFWAREREANFSRKKDISNLNYLIITEEKIPQNLHTEAEKNLLALCGKKMLNLSGQSNTDLKLAYGVANLEELSACDDRFCTFETNAAVYSRELTDAGQIGDAKALLTLAVSYHADNSSIYTQLAALCQADGDSAGIAALFDTARQLPPLPQQLILEKLAPFAS